MPLEVELKYEVTDFARIRSFLSSTGARLVHPDAHERNAVLDTHEGSIRASGCLLRLREYGGEVRVTFKEPLEPGPAKSRMEHEKELPGSFERYLRLFSSTGCNPVYNYEKNREIWELEGCHICLDTLYYGMFVEVEAGSSTEVFRVSRLLGLDPCTSIVESYAALEAGWKYSNS